MSNHHPTYSFPAGYTPWNKGKHTGHAPWRGKKRPNLFSETTRIKLAKNLAHVRFDWTGTHKSPQTIEKFRLAMRERNLNGKAVNQYGPYKGLEGRKRNNERNDPAYLAWSGEIRKRDKGQCRLATEKCSGYKIVHHILPWRDYPDERYNINNGITLCQFHHPLKRDDEQRLIPALQALVGSNNNH